MTRKLRRLKIPYGKHKKRRNMLSQILADHKAEYIIGLDEVGWGAIAGPVAVGCAVYKVGYTNKGIRDSKSYSERTRQKAFVIVSDTALFLTVETASPSDLELYGAGPCLQQLFLTAANKALALFPNSILVIDGKNEVNGYEGVQCCFPKADKFVCSVGAASVYAKVTRDSYMVQLHKTCPEFDWKTNKGYPTPAHTDAMKRHGVSIHHRHSIDMVKQIESYAGSYERKHSEDQGLE